MAIHIPKYILNISIYMYVCLCVCNLQQKFLLSFLFLVMLIASSSNSSWYFYIRCLLCLPYTYYIVYIISAAQRMWFDNSLHQIEMALKVSDRDRDRESLLWMQSVVTDETNGHGMLYTHLVSQSNMRHETWIQRFSYTYSYFFILHL